MRFGKTLEVLSLDRMVKNMNLTDLIGGHSSRCNICGMIPLSSRISDCRHTKYGQEAKFKLEICRNAKEEATNTLMNVGRLGGSGRLTFMGDLRNDGQCPH